MQSVDQVSQVVVTKIVKCLPSDDVDVDVAVFSSSSSSSSSSSQLTLPATLQEEAEKLYMYRVPRA